jgi:hypothetical protein
LLKDLLNDDETDPARGAEQPVRSMEVSWRFQPFKINDLELVAQIFPRWNRVADWLREAERFSTAA